MKKITILFLSLTFAMSSFAQSVDDALLISSNNYEGTARTLGMGNAVTAVGGDMGAVGINPAASGVMRSSQFSFSLGGIKAKSKISGIKDNFSNLAVPNCGYIGSFDTNNKHGLFNFNFGILFNERSSFNQIYSLGINTGESSYLSSLASNLAGINYKDLEYDNSSSYNPFNNQNVSWPEVLAWNNYVLATTPDSETDYLASTENTEDFDIMLGGELGQDYYRKRDGGVSDLTVNFGGNIEDILFFGVNLNVASVDLNVTESYAERAINDKNFQDGFVRYAQQYSQYTSGAGVNAQFGVIFTPREIDGLRLGASYTTKTAYTLTDSWRYFAQSDFNNGNHYEMDSPSGYCEYNMYAPSRFNIGAAYTLGKTALFSIDYEQVNYRNIYFEETDGNTYSYQDLNSKMSNQCNNSHVIRYGIEWWIGDLAIRGGSNIYSAPATWAQAKRTKSLGLGWRLSDTVLFDCAWQGCSVDSDFQMYSDYDGGNVPKFVSTNKLNKLIFTLTCKF